MDNAPVESNPDVGSSRNSNASGFAASSTPIVTRFLSSTVRLPTPDDKPGGWEPISALERGSSSSRVIMRSTSESLVVWGVDGGWRRVAEKSRASRTVEVPSWTSCCSTKPVLRLKSMASGLPSSRNSPVTVPMRLRWERVSSSVVLPAPLGPISAVSRPGLT